MFYIPLFTNFSKLYKYERELAEIRADYENLIFCMILKNKQEP